MISRRSIFRAMFASPLVALLSGLVPDAAARFAPLRVHDSADDCGWGELTRDDDGYIWVDASRGPATVTLPPLRRFAQYRIGKVDDSENAVIIWDEGGWQ